MRSEQTGPRRQEVASEPFHYAPTGDNGPATAVEEPAEWNAQTAVLRSEAEQRERDALQRGLREGEGRARAELAGQAAEQRTALATSLEAFKAERAGYFGRLEPEVVKLALAMTRKILHREAQIDPLLLTGMVHAALDKIERGTHIRLRAHPADVHFWREHFAARTDGAAAPELAGDAQLKRGECALETEMGHTPVSLDAHLKEIEQGFLDLLEQRPHVQ